MPEWLGFCILAKMMGFLGMGSVAAITEWIRWCALWTAIVCCGLGSPVGLVVQHLMRMAQHVMASLLLCKLVQHLHMHI